MRPVILSGGAGTRLWPLSTEDVPKQFAALIDGKSLFSLTIARLEGLTGTEGVMVVTGKRHVPLVVEELVDRGASTVLVEPEGRNTAPAAIAAALVARPSDVLLILPADHLITDLAGFQDTVKVGAGIADEGAVVTFGMTPSRLETGYGYIEPGERIGRAHAVARFKEKPGLSEARSLASDGHHLWNSGMFVARADTIIQEAARLCADVLDAVRDAVPADHDGIVPLGGSFTKSPSISFDHAIMEKTELGRVIPADFGWSDVGSYVSLLEASERGADGNHSSGDVTLSDVTGSFVKATSRQVVVAGVDDVVVVETPDAVLVVALDHAQDVRELRRHTQRD